MKVKPCSDCVADLKCDFDETNPELPCRRCVSKRYTCGEEVLGPKSQMMDESKQNSTSVTTQDNGSNIERRISLPHDPTRDFHILQSVQNIEWETRFSLTQTRMNFENLHAFEELLRSRRNILASLMPFRYAALVYISHHQYSRKETWEHEIDRETCGYLQQFFVCIANTIADSALADVIRASAIIRYMPLPRGSPFKRC